MQKKVKKVPIHYVNNKMFYDEIVKYRERIKLAESLGKEAPIMPDYLGECIYKIATKLSYKPCFMSYSFREEMVEDGIENSIMYFKDFDPEKTQNPFAYFTQVIYYAFLRRIAKEERNRYTTYKFFQESIIHSVGSDTLIDIDDNNVMPSKMYDNINDFMTKFEKKEEDKKIKRKEKKGLQKFYEEQKNAEITKSVEESEVSEF